MRLPRIFLVMKKRRYAFLGESFCFFIVFGVVLLIAGSDGVFGSAGVYLPALDDTFAANRLPHHLRASQVVSGLTLIGAVSLLDDTLYDAVHEARSPARAAFFNKTTTSSPELFSACGWPKARCQARPTDPKPARTVFVFPACTAPPHRVT